MRKTETETVNELLKKCKEEEQELQFEHFSQNDAEKLGRLIQEASQNYSGPVSAEIRLNGLTVYRFFPNGTTRNNEVWMNAKAATVEMLGISSLHLYAQMKAENSTLEDLKMDEMIYAKVGGGFPLMVRNCGMVGSICVSGLFHTDDHQVIIDALHKCKSRRGSLVIGK